MSERNGYQPGVPCWVDTRQPDPRAAADFYTRLFGWEADTFAVGDLEATLWRLPGFVGGEPEQPVPADVIATSMPSDGPPKSSVDFWVDDTDATAARAAELGGTAIVPPFNIPIGRTAILADPQGATFSISRVVPA